MHHDLLQGRFPGSLRIRVRRVQQDGVPVPDPADPFRGLLQVRRNLSGAFRDPVRVPKTVQVRVRLQFTVLEEEDPVRAFFKVRGDMGGEKDGLSVIPQAQEDLGEFVPADGIETAGGFVEDQPLESSAGVLSSDRPKADIYFRYSASFQSG